MPCCPPMASEGQLVEPYVIESWADQGLSPREEAVGSQAIELLLEDPDVHMVATARLSGEKIHYFVHSRAGFIEYVREVDGFVVVRGEGENPLANDDPSGIGTLEAFLAVAENPEGTVYDEAGYAPGDDRVAFIPAEQMPYPFAYERVASYFDDPRAGDLALVRVSYASGGFSSHGHLGAVQSRSPLLWVGPGVRTAADGAREGDTVQDLAGEASALFRMDAARGVDIAPTVAAALGVARHPLGVVDGVFRAESYLSRQDGRVLREIFTTDALEAIDGGDAIAERAIIVINDGLTALELNHEITTPGYEVSAYRALASRGLNFQYGSITNWPSNTYPSHNMIGSGAYSGHHGVLDNNIHDRHSATTFSLISSLFDTEKFYGSSVPMIPVETLFEAVERSFPGAFTVSINDPSSRGADFSTLERRKPDALVIPDPEAELMVGGVRYTIPAVDTDDFEGLVDNSTLFSLVGVYLGDALPPPKVAIVNFSSTDGAGHAGGPHGELLRRTVMPRMNVRMEILLSILEQAGLLDSTLVVLTSDHGMELKDRSRTGSPTTTLQASDIRFRRVGDGIYFLDLAAEVQRGEGELTVTVFDEDTVLSEDPVRIASARVAVVDGAAPAEAYTDADGVAVLSLVGASGPVTLEIRQDAFNPLRYVLD